jgi:DNA mismatch endonuclease, patch repair protein
LPKTNSSFWRAKIERNLERDRATVRTLRAAKVRVLRLWEHEVASVRLLGLLRQVS